MRDWDLELPGMMSGCVISLYLGTVAVLASLVDAREQQRLLAVAARRRVGRRDMMKILNKKKEEKLVKLRVGV